MIIRKMSTDEAVSINDIALELITEKKDDDFNKTSDETESLLWKNDPIKELENLVEKKENVSQFVLFIHLNCSL